jgi:DNA-binding NtrC family response regulator
MSRTGAVLIIDDDAALQRGLLHTLAPACAVHVASSGEEGLTQYERVHPDVVLLDVMLPQMGGMAVLRALKRMSADLPVIMITAYAEVQTAVQAIKLGATDYLQKPLHPESVLRRITQLLDDAPREQSARSPLIGQSAAMRRVRRLIESFGPTDIPVLLQGETGTGKGLIAHAMHGVSKRAGGTFVPIDCATIPEQLAESELFGYEDGAFTGAGKKRRGRVAFANGGTLFLDEIGTLAMGTQAKLLTLVEQQSFVPLGARRAEPTQLDVRCICATNVPLQRAVDEGTFRADLFHRLNGITIELPPLRDRVEDIELLARHFLAASARQHGKPDLDISDEALEVMQEYSWPGNVRELQRVVFASAVMADTSITVADLPEHVRAHRSAAAPRMGTAALPVLDVHAMGELDPAHINLREIKEWAGREAQKLVIQELQKRTNITRQDLARALGVDPKTLRARLKETSHPKGGQRSLPE